MTAAAAAVAGKNSVSFKMNLYNNNHQKCAFVSSKMPFALNKVKKAMHFEVHIQRV